MFPAVFTYVPFGHDPVAAVGGKATVVLTRATTVEVVARRVVAEALRETTVVDGEAVVVVVWTAVEVIGTIELGDPISAAVDDAGTSERVDSDVDVELSERSDRMTTTATASAPRPRPLGIRWRTSVPPLPPPP